MPEPSTKIEPVELAELKLESLHAHWPFVRRGLDAIHQRLKPDWIPENVFAALVAGHSSCVVVSRGARPIGFVVYYKQPRPFSFKPELFVWAAWALPLRERLQSDNLPEAIAIVWRYLVNVAKGNYGTNVISWISPRGGFERKYGWKPHFKTFQIEV